MKRSAEWSYGILLVMLGLVFAISGGMWLLMLPARGVQRFGLIALCIAGCVGIGGGALTAYRAQRATTADDRRIPRARALRRR